MPLAAAIAATLEMLGYGVWGGGTTAGASIFANREPPYDPPGGAPAAILTVYATGGAPDTLDLTGGANGERSALLRLRDDDPAALEARVEALYALWTSWKSYPAQALTLKAATKPLLLYPAEDSNDGPLYIGSFTLVCIYGS